MLKFEKFTSFRRKYLRPIYFPFLKMLHHNYLYLKRINLARHITREFNSALEKYSDSTVVISYDHSCSPPTYGDFFVILMIARFISMSGQKVRFKIIDLNRNGAIWNSMNKRNQDLFVLDQINLAQKLLNQNCEIKICGKFANKSTPVNKGSHEFPSNILEVYSTSFYQWAPYFLHLLIKKHNWPIPKGFLLKSMKDRPVDSYVTWNVRKSLWARHRDTDVNSILNDFIAIRNLFPEHSIVILSNQEGINFALKELNRINPMFTSLLASGRILVQPDSGYQGAIDWILNSDMYFQRSGGGMGVVAIFSSVPYVIYSVEKTSFFGHYRNRKIAPWSREDQIFKRLFTGKKTFPFSKNLNLPL